VVARDKVLREIAEASKGEFREGTIGNPSVRPAWWPQICS
jgi:hypothetical protein